MVGVGGGFSVRFMFDDVTEVVTVAKLVVVVATCRRFAGVEDVVTEGAVDRGTSTVREACEVAAVVAVGVGMRDRLRFSFFSV